MHKVLDEDTIKPEILPQIVCGKTWVCFRRRLGGSYSMRSLRVESLAVDSRLLPLFHDVVLVGREQHPPQPLALAVASLHVFCVVPMHTYAAQSFCIVFGKKFNTKSGFFVHQPLTLPQKIDSREGLFWYKKGLACECSEMNIYFNEPSFAPVLRLFAAKWSAICRKTKCILVLNAVRFGAKCSAFWC